MTKRITVFFIMLSCSYALAQSRKVGTFHFRKRVAGHEAKVVFRTRAFDSATKKVGYDEKIGNTVNGRKAYGAEGIPKVEIASMTFFFDGVERKVPRWLYSDCYDPNFDSKDYVELVSAETSLASSCQ